MEIPTARTQAAAMVGIAGRLLPGPRLDYPPCVYFLSLRGEVRYVGASVSLLGRVFDHRKVMHKPHGIPFDKVDYLPVALEEMWVEEARWIELLQPAHNSTVARRRAGRAVIEAELIARLDTMAGRLPKEPRTYYGIREGERGSYTLAAGPFTDGDEAWRVAHQMNLKWRAVTRFSVRWPTEG